MSVPALNPVDRRLWAAARRLATFDRSELAAAAGTPRERAVILTIRLESEGVIRVADLGRYNRYRYEVVRPDAYPDVVLSPQAEPATAEGNMWTAIRALHQFTPRDLVAHGATEEVAVTEAAATAYCRLLMRGGYLRAVRKAVPGRQEPIYRLLRNTGPRPPRERRVVGLYDPNTAELVVPDDARGGAR